MGRLAQISTGVIFAGLFIGGMLVAVDEARQGNWIALLVTVFAIPFFAIGAIGGLLGPERLPNKSIAELVGWPAVERGLNRPIQEWFTPRRSRS